MDEKNPSLKLLVDADKKQHSIKLHEKVSLTWEDFNSGYLSQCPLLIEVQSICQEYHENVLDLHPYMIQRPYRCFENDTIEKINEMYRFIDLRTLPVLKEETH